MPKRKPLFAWDEYRDKILAALDLRAELTALGVKLTTGEPGDGGWLSCHAIDREDRTPSAAANLQTGAYVDFGGSGQRLGFFDLAAATGKHATWQAARVYYAAKASIEMHGAPPPRSPAENLEFLPWTPGVAGTELKAKLWCMKKTGVTVEAIKAAGGRFAKYMGHYTTVALPIWGPALLQSEPAGWVLYNTTGLALPVYHGKDHAATWTKVKTTSGSGPGIIGQHALKKIQDWKPAEMPLTIWKVEGPSDVLAMWAAIDEWKKTKEAIGTEKHVVLTNAGGATESASGPKSWMLSPFTGHDVVVIGDADTAGHDGAEKWAASIAKVANSMRIASLPYPVEKKHGRDIRDFINGY